MKRKRLEQKLQKIAKLYMVSIEHACRETSFLKNKRLSSFQSAVELAYASLSAPLQKIINNDFFYQDYPGWWKLIYKKNNYQRLKAIAINDFLEVFYEI